MKSVAGIGAVAAAAPAISATTPASKRANSKRNIVLIVSDDHGLDLGCYGNKAVKSPALDALAADGVMFSNAFCTTSSCSPSRSVILTGMHNHANGQYGLAHGKNNFSSHDAIVSLPARLSEAGYRTARAGKYHVLPESAYHFETQIQGRGYRNGVALAENCKPFFEADDDRPFFLYFCLGDPHRSGKEEKENSLSPDRFGNDEMDEGDTIYSPDDVEVPGFLPDLPQTREELANYYQSVTRMDSGVGKLIEVLKETGLYETTLIIYVSDNGIPFPGAKTTLYEPGIRLPCIVRAPEQDQRGHVCDAMISWIDLAPTILDFAGVKEGSKHPMHGRSFLKVLDQENPKGWDEVAASHTFHEVTMYYPMRVIRERRYKLIWNIAHPLEYPTAADLWGSSTWQATLKENREYYGKRKTADYLHRPEFELYDLENDPDELVNLAGMPEHKETLERMIEKLKEFQKETRDPWVLKWTHE